MKQHPIQMRNRYQHLELDNSNALEIPYIILKLSENYNIILQEIIRKYPGTTNTLFRGSIKITPKTMEERNEIIKLLQDKKQEYVLYEPTADRPIKAIIKGLHINTRTDKKELEEINYEVIRIHQFKNFKEQSLLPIFQIDVRRTPQTQNIYNIIHLCYLNI
ncbi:hypothetical protein AVEN_255129-1 [Araneus ventricosus]|uniref:Pre-C2HC domain-containing protein n=1 Tax=Araneus ventricosus TaxID=182803 RepID=A0A4Y2BCE2_ARAVE|nr:hypothetical protein AVEN_255129-1 [Araneus ventricosus]